MNEDKFLNLLNGNAPPVTVNTVSGRVLHCDADFLAYQSGHAWESETPEESISDLKIRIEDLRNLALAEVVVLHLTLGTKGGRHEIAQVKEYQGHRKKDDGLRARVTLLRQYMAKMFTNETIPHAQYDQEADDSLCQAMWDYKVNPAGAPPVLWSIDKDLKMVGGLHLNNDNGKIEERPWGYGHTYLDRTKSAPKINGNGTSFFFHQLLVGDTADGIPGLPRIGAIKAIKILEGATSEKNALSRVRQAYLMHYGRWYSFTTWRGHESGASADGMLLEQAHLLWMRRERGQDVCGFLKEVVKP
jgi:hypothetical protein